MAKKEKAELETPKPCICGGGMPVMVKHRYGLFYSCRNTMTCSTRGTWQKTEQQAVHSWNMAVTEAKTDGGGKHKC